MNFKSNHFDLIIAYGIFHALDDINDINRLLVKSHKWLKKGGYYIIATFTNKLPPPKIQDYLEYKAFVDAYEFISQFKNYKIILSENDIITETHSTTNIEHKHSIIRLIMQKNGT